MMESHTPSDVITVVLNLDYGNFLGVSIVGQSDQTGDKGIYVGDIMKDSVVDLDGRIDRGDKILQINEVNLEKMDNYDAVSVLRDAVQTPGPITLIVSRHHPDPCPSPQGDCTISRSESICPLDFGASGQQVADFPPPLTLPQASNCEDRATAALEHVPHEITPERQPSPKGTAPNLPLLCVEAICKFAPTSSLVRLHSVAVPLPGAAWNVGVQSVLRRRLPFSISDASTYHQAVDPSSPALIFDSSGAKVATVTQPAALSDSSIWPLVESATLGVRLVSPPASFFSWWNPQQRYVVGGNALLCHLPSVRKLTLKDVCPLTQTATKAKADRPLLSVKHLLPQLEAFTFRSDFASASEVLVLDSAVVELMREMPNLKRLDIPLSTFNVLKRAKWFSKQMPALSHVDSLGIWQRTYGDTLFANIPSAADLVAPWHSQLSQLSIFVRGDFKTYLTAFKAMPCLRTLGLRMCESDLTGLTLNEGQLVPSVLELRLCCADSLSDRLTPVFSFFPNVATAVLQSTYGINSILRLASMLFDKRPLPKLTRLAFANDYFPFLLRECLLQFLSGPNVSSLIDLTQVRFADPSTILLMDETLLTSLFCAMQSSPVRTLLLRGPVPRNGLIRLLGHLALNAADANVAAWRDRDLCDLVEVADDEDGLQQTNFKIVGAKTSGNLKGERFTIRVLHQHAKRRGIFD